MRSHNACRIGIWRWAVVKNNNDVAWSVWKRRISDAPVRGARHWFVPDHGMVVDVTRNPSFHIGPKWSVTVGCLESTSVSVRASPDTKSRDVADFPRSDDVLGEL
eukprot:8140706-Pyramimonas_sp.AAC.1